MAMQADAIAMGDLAELGYFIHIVTRHIANNGDRLEYSKRYEFACNDAMTAILSSLVFIVLAFINQEPIKQFVKLHLSMDRLTGRHKPE